MTRPVFHRNDREALPFLILMFSAWAFLTATLATNAYSQQFIYSKPNKTKNGYRHGLWISYTDSSNTILEWKGRFRKGNEKGVWKYYYSNGTVRKKEIYRFKKIKTYTYFPSGKLESTGNAKLLDGNEKLEYFYYGPWNYYSEEGKVIRIVHYEKGAVTKEEIIQ